MLLNRPTLAVLVALLCAAPAQEALLIRNVSVFDGLALLGARDVVIADGRIEKIGIGLDGPAGAPIVDGDGLTLLPGLIDAHTHVLSAASLEQALALGVTTELDMFMDWNVARAIKKAEQGDGYTGSADLRSAGTLITAPGGPPR